MIRNPVLQESRSVYLHRREYLFLHLGYLAFSILMIIIVWPARGLMHFFRTQSPPPVYDVMVIYHAITLCAISVYIGLDRLAEDGIIRYSEWLERTTVPIRVLAVGKLSSAAVHTLMLTVLTLPLLAVAAGPAGVPLWVVAVAAGEILLAAFMCRIAGMMISHWGESSYVIRVVGGWVFIALLFVATVEIAPAVNPVIAVARLHSAESPVFTGVGPSPVAAPVLAYASAVLVLGTLHATSLSRHRYKAEHHVER